MKKLIVVFATSALLIGVAIIGYDCYDSWTGGFRFDQFIRGVFMLLFGTALVLAGGAIYLLPTIVAISLRHSAALGIALINVAFGWTVLGWVVSFIWACNRPKAAVTIIQQTQPSAIHLVQPPPVPTPARGNIEAELATLLRLRDSSLITEEEYASRRERILDSIG